MVVALIAGCAAPRPAEDTDGWWAPGEPLDVEEPVAFTTDPYGFDGGIAELAADLFPTEDDGFVFAPDDDYGDARCTTSTSDALPTEITGVATIPPRFYFKTTGCTNDDEKYYGSFFLQDAERGVFVLGDSKTSHFAIGDVVTIRVRGVRTRYDLDMVYSWDLVEVADPLPVHYDEQVGPFTLADVSHVRRITGTVTSPPTTFGEVTITSDAGQAWGMQLDAELNRRGITFTVGERVTVTGPVLYAYDAYNVVIQTVGQITRED